MTAPLSLANAVISLLAKAPSSPLRSRVLAPVTRHFGQAVIAPRMWSHAGMPRR